MRALVTGGAGFIGANLCARLSRDPRIASLVVLDDLSSGSRENLADLDVELVVGSVLDADAVGQAARGADAVVHLAAAISVADSANIPLATHEINATGTMNVLEQARRCGVAHVVLASSSAVYGQVDGRPCREDAPPSPASVYGASKLAAEAYALAYQACFGLGVLALRFFNVYGPLQSPASRYAAVVPAFVSAALADTALILHGDGTQTRDFVFVDDVCAVIQDAIAHRVCHATAVNVGTGTGASLLELVATLEGLLGRAVRRDVGPARPGDVHDACADISVMKQLFPQLRPRRLTDGLAETVRWAASARSRGAPIAAEGHHR